MTFKPTAPDPDSAGPRWPDLTPEQALALADRLLAQRRARNSRLSGAHRFRRWGA